MTDKKLFGIDNWHLDPDWKQWFIEVEEELVPMMKGSGVVMSLVPDRFADVDIKFAVELGLSLMLDKPLMLLVRPGAEIPKHLRRCADAIVEIDINDPGSTARIQEAIKAMDVVEEN